ACARARAGRRAARVGETNPAVDAHPRKAGRAQPAPAPPAYPRPRPRPRPGPRCHTLPLPCPARFRTDPRRKGAPPMLDLELAAAQRHDLLTLFPLVAVGEPELPYALLVDALAAGTVRITEVGAGTVPALLAWNAGDVDVLVLDGEQLVGARQNRMTNRSI